MSSSNRTKITQNRRSYGQYEPHRLDPDFPITAVAWVMGDQPGSDQHRHDVLEIGLCHAGHGQFVVGGKILRFAPGQVLAINDREPHRAWSDPGTRSRWTFIFVDPPRLLGAGRGEDAAALAIGDLGGPAFINLLDPEVQPLSCQLAFALGVALADPAEGGRRPLVRGLVLALLAELHRLPGIAPDSSPRTGVHRMAPALRLIAEEHHCPLPIPRLARACGLGVSAFRAAFTTTMGLSPQAWLIRSRLHRAAGQLEAGSSVTDAAFDNGFGTLSSFHRHFKTAFGCTPRGWRR